MQEARNLLEMLYTSVERYGARTALWDPLEDGSYATWTYEQLWRDIHRVASRLAECGVGRGDFVGLIATTRAWWPIADFAIMSLGAHTVPVYPSVPSNQVQFILAHAGVRAVFVENAEQLEKVVAEQAHLPALEFVVVLDEVADGPLERARALWPVYQLRDWLRGRAGLTDTEWEARWRALPPEHVATIVYTSGTTGFPKGVQLTHGNLVANVEGIRHVVRLRPEDRSLSYLPLSHIFERTAGQFVPLQAGASIAYSRGMKYITEEFVRMPPTVFTTVPRLLEKVYEAVQARIQAARGVRRRMMERALALGTAARVEGRPVPAWELALYDRLVLRKVRQALGGRIRAVIVGGAPMPLYVGRFFTAIGVPVAEGYGMTETSPVVSANFPEQPRLGTAGKVLPNLEVRIAEDGEVLVRGPSVTPGYLHNEEATREAIDADGWLHTGDIGELSEDGYLRITDRKKNLLVLSTGKKVTPAPIEGAIVQNPYIDQALLIGAGYKYVSVIVVPNEEAVGRWLAERGRHLPRAQWSDDAGLADFLLAQVTQATAGFARFEQPKKVLVAREPFTLENELLTPTLKIRARNVLALYAKEIEALYSEAKETAPA
ncbi:MAG: long-chain fatty acid--CoA ligase [Alicyclobacillus macrosporangiidus]|uniref:AMP-dependent synthetase/ligase n=1 Tax=Alicyclobacillus macrosporangiidus TaxID=392015 RepID=UPI0026EB0700|nr:long-chain fatty acid--CoA ligase [Alicyclobacillus macrosporangiidus]MCL6598306.1 long-chain fatty acid--CoA ligase [Alicyclobacillus macrosporangiidus]